MRSLIRQIVRLQYLGLVMVVLLAPLVLASVGYAQSATSAIAQQYQVDGTGVSAAAIVGLKQTNSNTIELSSSGKEQRLIGIVSNKSAIELSGGENGVQVVTSGLATALVSDLNGAVKAGDKITASPIQGVGMKATQSGVIVGTAQASLDTAQADTRTVSDKSGKKQTVHIALVPVQVGVGFFSVSDGDGENPFIPSFMQSIADTIAGQEVSAMRVIAAGTILFLVVISVAALLYGAVRSSIISIGRNPLSEAAVRKSLFQVGITSVGVLLFAGIAIYMILAL